MTSPTADLSALIFRASPAFELRAFEALEPPQRQALSTFENGEYYGVLLPTDGSRSAKLVDHEAARVVAALHQPGTARHLGNLARNPEAIIALVLDGILEVQDGNGADGFITGAAASARFGSVRFGLGETTEMREPSNRIEHLSLEALRYAERLGLDDARLLAGRLYAYNRLPASSALLERFGDADRVAAQVGLEHTIKALESGWGYARPDGTHAWHAWERRAPYGLARHALAHTSGWTYKLYLSPMPHVLRDALAVWVEHVGALGAFSFKLGKDALGVLRPDKFVAYFRQFSSLERAAALLGGKLSGLPAHGVPFSAALDADGLLSWGSDPPSEASGRESWRSWLTERLAAAIVEGRRDASDAQSAHRFALERVRLEGVDTRTWTPRPDIWAGPETVPDGLEYVTTAPSGMVNPTTSGSEVSA